MGRFEWRRLLRATEVQFVLGLLFILFNQILSNNNALHTTSTVHENHKSIIETQTSKPKHFSLYECI